MKKIIPWMLATAVIMLVFPWLAVTFIKGDGGMAVCFILFFAVNPIYAICSGAYAGKDIKIFWSLPIITALFFLLGSCLFFSIGDSFYFIQYIQADNYKALRIFLWKTSMNNRLPCPVQQSDSTVFSYQNKYALHN